MIYPTSFNHQKTAKPGDTLCRLQSVPMDYP